MGAVGSKRMIENADMSLVRPCVVLSVIVPRDTMVHHFPIPPKEGMSTLHTHIVSSVVQRTVPFSRSFSKTIG